MLKLFGFILLVAVAFYGAEKAGWLTAEQAQYVPQLEAAVPEALQDSLTSLTHELPDTRSFTERVAGE